MTRFETNHGLIRFPVRVEQGGHALIVRRDGDLLTDKEGREYRIVKIGLAEALDGQPGTYEPPAHAPSHFYARADGTPVEIVQKEQRGGGAPYVVGFDGDCLAYTLNKGIATPYSE
jgi:hypothetical protein